MFYNCQLDHGHQLMKHIPRTYKFIKVTHREYMLKTQHCFPFPAWSIHVIRDFVGAVYTVLTVGIQIYFSRSLMDVTTCWSEIDKSKGIANYSKHHEIWYTVLHIEPTPSCPINVWSTSIRRCLLSDVDPHVCGSMRSDALPLVDPMLIYHEQGIVKYIHKSILGKHSLYFFIQILQTQKYFTVS